MRPMKVNIIDVDGAGNETVRAKDVFLDECFPGDENAHEREAADGILRCDGRYWVGGGAAELVLLVRAW